MAQLGGATQSDASVPWHAPSDSHGQATVALAYLLNPTFWGYGYVQEGCHPILALLFTGYQVQSVQAEVDTRNHASCTLLARLGFRQIGVRPNADHCKGASSDEYTYELTHQEWQAILAEEISP